MFCGNCGAQNADNSAFCKNCGATLNATSNGTVTYQAPKKPLDKKLIGMIAGGAAAVVLVVVLLIVFLGGGAGAGSPEGVAEKYAKASISMDVGAMLDLIPEEAQDFVAEESGYGDLDEMKDAMKESAEEAEAMMDSMNMKVSADAGEAQELDEDELEALQAKYEDELKIEITNAAVVEVEMTIKASFMGETINETQSESIAVVEIDGTWYLDVFDLDF